MAEKKDVPAKTGSVPAVTSLREQFDRLFDNMMTRWPGFGWPEASPGDMLTTARQDFAVKVDTAETEKAYEVTVELPGVEEKDVSVTLNDDVLTVKGEKRTERDETEKNYHLTERSYGAFERSFRLPENVDPGKIAAGFDKGVLKVTLPKSPEPPKNRRAIPIGKAA
jgi:HSP20 family protein